MQNPQSKKRLTTFWIARIILLGLIILEIQSNRTPILLINTLVFLLTFAPTLAQKILSINLPLSFELLYLLSLLAAVFFEKLFAGSIVQVVLGTLFGIFGFLLMYSLYYNNRMEASYKLIAFSSFSFSVSVGALWEVFRYLLHTASGITIGYLSTEYASIGLTFTIIGATIVSILGYLHLKYGRGKGLSWLANAFVRENPELFADDKTSPEHILNLIEEREGEQLEFKSTLRKNLHTNKPDEKVEQAVMKTITAFLNTDGGVLLIGVSDDGKITGIKKDGFKNNDKFYRHYTNLVRDRINNKYLPLIKSNIIQINEKNVLKVNCRPSSEEVFLKADDEEQFYVRTGPASMQLTGRKLVEYINEKFK